MAHEACSGIIADAVKVEAEGREQFPVMLLPLSDRVLLGRGFGRLCHTHPGLVSSSYELSLKGVRARSAMSSIKHSFFSGVSLGCGRASLCSVDSYSFGRIAIRVQRRIFQITRAL